ncbi:MAG: serine/threonine-protein kinase [Beijerinckiaceae bacterium]
MNKTVVQFRGTVRGAVPAGTRLNDMYEVDVMIATGGMGEIYRGKLVETGDTVAIKMIKPEFTDNESVMALFRKEASALHHLFHDSIVRNYGFAVDRRINRAFLAMEFVEGNSLADLLKTRPLSLDEVNLLRHRLAAGLQVAHDKGIVHRDISPDNILLPGDDVRNAKIIDFGIARTTKLGHATVIGDGFAGKYNYVSPEQLGMHGGDVTNRSDIYSLGLLLAEALTGTPIDMSGSQVDVIDKRRQVPDVSHLPEKIRPLIAWMLQPDPKDRPESMKAVADWVYTPPQAPAARSTGRRSALKTDVEEKSGSGGKIAMIGGGVAAVLGAVAFFLLRPGNDPAPIPPPPIVVSAPVPAPVPSAPAPRTGPLTKPEQVERILNYIRYYDGDRCLLLYPSEVSDRSATLEALAREADAVRVFEQDFNAVNGFSPSVVAQPLTEGQCNAVALTHWIDAKPDLTLKAQQAANRYRPGDTVRITYTGAGNRTLEALLINEDGSIRVLSPQMRRNGDDVVLESAVGERNGSAGRKLVLTIAYPSKIVALDKAQSQTPEELYASIAREVQGKAVTVIPALIELQ